MMFPKRPSLGTRQPCCCQSPVAPCTHRQRHGVVRQRRRVVVSCGVTSEPRQPLSPEVLNHVRDTIHDSIRAAVQQGMRPLHEDLKLVREDTGFLRREVGLLKADVGNLRQDVGHIKEGVEKVNTQLRRVWPVKTAWSLSEDLDSVLDKGRSLLQSPDDVLSIVVPGGTELTVEQLVSAIGEDGFWSLLRAGVTFVQDRAPVQGVASGNRRGRRANPKKEAGALARAAADLRSMDADGLIKAGSAGERPLADAMEVVDALRRSGVGGMFLVDHLEEYVKFPEKRAGLRAGRLFMPFLSAAATGCPVDVLRLDRCGRVKVDTEVSRPYAALHIGELMTTSREGTAVSQAREHVARSATILAWAYHALRLRGAQHLPAVLDVWGYVIVGQDDNLPANPPQFARVESLPVLGCPLTVYFKYYEVSVGRVKQWGHTK